MSIAMDRRVVESHSDRVPESVDDPTRHSAKLVVELDENLFDGIKIRTVRRQIGFRKLY